MKRKPIHRAEGTACSRDERFDLFTAALPTGVFYCDAYGDCFYVNDHWRRITGTTQDDWFGASWKRIIDPERAQNILSDWEAKRAQAYTTEFWINTPENGRRWARFHSAPLRDRRGIIVGYSGTLEDISEVKQTEARLARERDEALSGGKAKSAFLANMSHEIRTPMNGIIGITSLLLDTKLDPQQRDYTETIRNSSEALLTILNDILDFSKIEAGKLTFEMLDFNLREMMESTLELLAVRAQNKGLELNCSLPENIPAALRGDPGRVRQVLTNLIGNAIKFTEKGEVFISITLEKDEKDFVTLRVAVRDTGIGIKTEAQARLFNPFAQAEEWTARSYGGTGLGLAISKQLVQLMQGQIGVESKPGQGSTFWFTVRLAKQSGMPIPVSNPGMAGVRVLVVDDNHASRQVLQHQLAAWKIHCTEVANAAEALNTLRHAAQAGTPFQIVLLDNLMPGMDGLELAHAIKDDPSVASARLILLTSLVQRLEDSVLRAAGIEDDLTKPVRRARLLEAISGIVGRKESPVKDTVDAVSAEKVVVSPPLKARILLAEDSAVNRKVALGQLKKLGYAADVVTNGTEVLRAIEQTSYDIILMDGQMPEMDGYETTRCIRQAEQTGKYQSRRPVHIIAMTANVMEGDRERCLEAGMNDYVSKPVRWSILQAAIQKWQPKQVSDSIEVSTKLAQGNLRVRTDIQTTAFAEIEPPVDIERLAELADGNVTEMRNLAEFYLNQADTLVSNLESAIQSGAATEVYLVAHKLAGSSATCGMVAIVPQFRELEAYGKAGTLEHAASVMKQVRKNLERTHRFVEDELESSPPHLRPKAA